MAPPPPEPPLRESAIQVAHACLAFRARALSRRISAIYEEEVRPLPIRTSQMNVMTPLAMSGGMRISTLAGALKLEASSLSRILDVMRRNGWVALLPDPDDERARIARLTPDGEALYRSALPAWRRAQARVEELLGEDGTRAFTALANEIIPIRAPRP